MLKLKSSNLGIVEFIKPDEMKEASLNRRSELIKFACEQLLQLLDWWA